ncbi:MAG TPA: NADH-quinone oxidoreductase subunit A [Candidatus Acidoferrum sp.]|nr:NADH-quinone oxidoreductase subunit A [Candidatus Acidoferrum sp.]
MPAAYIPVFLYSVLLLLILIAAFFLSTRMHVKSEKALETSDQVPNRGKFSANYCLGAMIYVIAAVQAIFLFSWAILYRAWLLAHAGVVALLSKFVFTAVLSVGYIWLYKKDAFTWDGGSEGEKENSETS